uniref:RRM domain-containing protein n=1 Tax=Ananas comosus var. bracteatus TaxID=296719 RepID=A0A6V7P668_ANACO|nr:unnamed protein product [Ananas comosus var. bracteatus]
MAASSSSSTSSASGGWQFRSRFGDTTHTKVFVGGLAWETPDEELRRYFEPFGDILEAVIIRDKNTGRSKGYGFVTFRDAESARRSVSEPNPVIDGRRANCNIASQGRPRPSPPRGRSPAGPPYQGPPQTMGPPYSRVPAQMPPPPPPVIYPTQFGYMTYPSDYGYQQAVYNPQMTPQYYQMYGPTSPSTVGPPPYHYTGMGYTMPNPRTSFQSPQHRPHPPYIQYPTAQMEGPFPPPSSPSNFQLQHPPHVRQQPLNITDSHASQPPSAAGSNAESTDA